MNTSSQNPTIASQLQAKLRLMLGIPVSILMVLCFSVWGSSDPRFGWPEIIFMAAIYQAYAVGAWWLSKREIISSKELTIATAVMDPAMLSGWLFILGPSSMIFSSFYLFTILGFGFRIGITTMRVCHFASLFGFTFVAVASPIWQQHLVATFSNALLLLIVPLYATSLLSSLHQMTRRAEAESLAKTQLLANVSHELRTPLNGIVSSVQLMISENYDNQQLQKRGNVVLELTGALEVEIDQLINASRLQSSDEKAIQTKINLKEKIAQIVASIQPIATMKKLELSYTYDDAIVLPVMAYSLELGSVLSNLIGNAVKFTEKGMVQISVKVIEQTQSHYLVRFVVNDTGIGIDSHHLNKLFDPFYRVDNGPSRRFGGTGLGTTIASEYVQKMGGELQVNSVPGQGSQFWFELSLPKAEEQEAQNRIFVPDNDQCVGPIPMSILVVDDNASNRTLLKELLEHDGHNVALADGGMQALQMINSMSFDAIFLDYYMADLDGHKVYDLYRFGKLKIKPTVFVTADTSNETQTKLMASGVTAVIHKPVKQSKLREVISGIAKANVKREDSTKSVLRVQRDTAPKLRVVQNQYLSEDAIRQIFETDASVEFTIKLFDETSNDIRRMDNQLREAWKNHNIKELKSAAHAMKGAALNVGAMRLASFASVLIRKNPSKIDFKDKAYFEELLSVVENTLNEIQQVIQSFQNNAEESSTADTSMKEPQLATPPLA